MPNLTRATCPACGEMNRISEPVCLRCGHPVERPSEAATLRVVTVSPDKRSGKDPVVVRAALLLLAVPS